MHKYLTFRLMVFSAIWLVLGPLQNVSVKASELKDPELYKQELLVIEKRLDAKLKELDEKLERLEKMESSATFTTVETPSASDDKEVTKAEEVTLIQIAEEPVVMKSKSNSSDDFANLSYGKNGFEFRTDNNKFSLAIQNRIQTRYSNPFDSDPRSIEDLERDESSFRIRRARTRLRACLLAVAQILLAV